jgi:hypothetical protein
MSAFLHYARLSYAATVFIATAVSIYVAAQFAIGLYELDAGFRSGKQDLVTAFLILAFLLPGFRALMRFARRLTFFRISADLRAYAWLTTIIGTVGHAVALNVVIAYYQILSEGKEASGVGFGFLVAGICYLTTLWIGEFVVMRNKPHRTTESPASD